MANRLAHETSPYLQQHAANPVDWYPWGEEALALARDTERPILLSVGYSACHWCHVMAHESFEDSDTAAIVNRHFVAIKVDREERPDLDQIYQAAHQLITRRGGGWPLTMFLTPEGKPFYGGTYFPKQSRYGLPGFDELLARIAQLWGERRESLLAQGDEVVRYLAQSAREGGAAAAGAAGAADSEDALETFAPRAGAALRDALMPSFDRQWGGFGGAPKFPQPALLEALLQRAMGAGDAEAGEAVATTLVRMGEGGLFDQLGGGFCRYSTDARWEIPHFEKMLYDNGPLLRLYAQAWRLDPSALFRRVCTETADWTMREMQSPEGGYSSSLDADSEGEEGRFYVWSRDEVARVLGGDFDAFALRYGLDQAPNFEGRSWHLRIARPVDEVAVRCGVPEAQATAQIERARERLFALRETRVHPGLDDKVLASWNALAIDGMAFAARVFAEPSWAASARDALDFVRATLWRDGRLLATYKDGRAHLNAYLDDHAFLLGALLECMQAQVLRVDDLRFACAIADAMLDRFEDREAGGFFFTSHDHEALVTRPKSASDAATASGNGVAALHLQRLGHVVGDARYLEAARRTMACFAADAQRAPHAFATLARAMAEYAAPPTVVVLTGPQAEIRRWSEALARLPLASTLIFALPGSIDTLPEALAKPVGEQARAWVCQGPRCLAPIDALDALRTQLAGEQPPGPPAGVR